MRVEVFGGQEALCLTGSMSPLTEGARVNSKPLETTPANGGALRYRSGSTNLDTPLPPSRRKVVGIYAFALLLALALFYFHVVVIFDVLGQMLRYKAWLLENMEPGNAGKLLLLGCFFALMSAHVAQAAVWGLYLRSTRLLPSIREGGLLHRHIDHNARLR